MQARKAYQDTHVVIDLSDHVFMDFLDAQKPKTKRTYTYHIHKLIQFTNGQSGEQILADRKVWSRKILNYLQWLKNQGYSDAYATTSCAMVRGLFQHYRKPLDLSKQDRVRLKERVRSTEDFLFSKDDLAKMNVVADLKERYVLLCNFGLRAEDFSEIHYSAYRTLDLNSEVPIALDPIQTMKEKGVKAFPFINSDSLPIIKAVLEANKDAKDSDRVWRERPQQLTVVLQNLVKKAGIDTHGKRVRFHCLRKYLCDALSSKMSESKWKQIIGKKIAESAYISTENLRECYLEAMSNIIISGNGTETKRKVSALEEALKEKDALIKQQQEEIEKLKSARTEDKAEFKRMFDDYDRELLEIQDKLHIKPRKQVKGEPDVT